MTEPMTDRAPRPEGMSDEDVQRITAAVALANSSMPCGDAFEVWQTAREHAMSYAADLLDEVSRLRADGATLRERVRKLPSPLSWHAADSDGEGCEAHIHCAWCGHNTPADSLRRDSLHHGTCLYAELASAPKEPTPHE